MKIKFDYRFDRSGFFNDPSRKAALEKAGEIWSSLLKDDFAPIPAGVQFSVQDPETGVNRTVVLEESIDDLVIFVGASSNPLGGGGGIQGELQAENPALGCSCWRCQAAATGDIELSQRGILARHAGDNNAASGLLALAGPQGSNTQGDVFQRRISENFRSQQVTDFEPWVGVAAFNNTSSWDFSLENPTGKFDFISVALHEIGHILGIGVSDTFTNLVRGNVFQGVNAKQVNGGNGIPLQSDLTHVQEGFRGNTVLMDPVYNGGRNLPTEIDLAMLADIGYEIEGYSKQGSLLPLATEAGETIFGSIVDDIVNALGGNDRLQGNQGKDNLSGGDGDDLVFGEAGDDRLFGNAGNDELQGGDGNDFLDGGAGEDRFFGGAGSDSFAIDFASETANISDFTRGEDLLIIDADFGFSDPGQILEKISSSGNASSGGLFSQLQLNDRTSLTVFHNTPLQAEDFTIASPVEIFVTPDSSGFALQLPRGLKLDLLNLYDLQNGDNKADIRLIGENSGEIKGSALWNEVDRTLTFIATGSPLTNDRYTLSLFGREDGFVNDDGTPLDGDNDGVAGGEFNFNFSIDNGTNPALTIADVIAAPAATTEIPIEIDRVDGISTIDFTVNYNPDILGVTGVNIDANLWEVRGQQIDSLNGTIALSLQAKTPLTGAIDILSLNAAVDANATYLEQDTLEIVNIKANDGGTAVIGDRSLQQVLLAGDTTANQAYSSLDASLISRVVSGIDDSFAAFPLTDPSLVGDTDFDRALTSIDASTIGKNVVGL